MNRVHWVRIRGVTISSGNWKLSEIKEGTHTLAPPPGACPNAIPRWKKHKFGSLLTVASSFYLTAKFR